MQEVTSNKQDATVLEEVQINDDSTPETIPSLRQPAWHVVVMSFFTFNMYCYYWLFKTWRDLHAHAAKLAAESALKAATAGGDSAPAPIEPPALGQFAELSPLLRAICMFVPGLNFYFLFKLFSGICRLTPPETNFQARHPRITSTVVIVSSIVIVWTTGLAGILFLLGNSVGLPLALIQHQLNIYWQSIESPQSKVRSIFTPKELMGLFVGMLWTGFTIAGLMLNIKPH